MSQRSARQIVQITSGSDETGSNARGDRRAQLRIYANARKQDALHPVARMAFVTLDVNPYELQLGRLKAEPCQPCAHLEHAVMAHHLGRKQGADEVPRVAVIAVIEDESAIDQTLTKIETQAGSGALLDGHHKSAHQLSVGCRK